MKRKVLNGLAAEEFGVLMQVCFQLSSCMVLSYLVTAQD